MLTCVDPFLRVTYVVNKVWIQINFDVRVGLGFVFRQEIKGQNTFVISSHIGQVLLNFAYELLLSVLLYDPVKKVYF